MNPMNLLGIPEQLKRARGLLGDSVAMIPGIGTVDAANRIYQGAMSHNLPMIGEGLADIVPAGRIATGLIGKATKGASTGLLGDVMNANSIKDIQDSLKSKGIAASLRERNGQITLDKIIVPKEQRGAGAGTEAMKQITDYADRTGQKIALTPSSDFGGDKNRLKEFYSKLGFADNKGKAKDFEVSESMLRLPSILGIQGGSNLQGTDSTQMNRFETDADRRMAVAQKNAVEMLGLPPANSAMDRAKAMGFDVDTNYIHSTDRVPDAVSDTGNFPGLFALPNQSSNYGNTDVPFLLKGPLANSDDLQGFKPKDLKKVIGRKGIKATDELQGAIDEVIPRDITDSADIADAYKAMQEKRMRLAKSMGHGAITIDDEFDGNTVALLNTPNLRSRFAAFDPARRNEADLLALNGSYGSGLLNVNINPLMGLLNNEWQK